MKVVNEYEYTHYQFASYKVPHVGTYAVRVANIPLYCCEVCGDADCNMGTDLIAISCAVILAAFGALSLLSLFRRVQKFEAEQQIDREHLEVLQKLVKKC